MFCGSCGSALPAEAAFCPSCGTAAARPAAAEPGAWWAPGGDPATQPTPVQPTPAQPTPVQPTPVQQAPIQPDPSFAEIGGPAAGFPPDGAPPANWSATTMPTHQPQRGTRNAARLAVAGAGVAAILLVLLLAAHAWGGHSGGASSPADATNRLANAVRHGDPVGVASMIAPGELASVTREIKGGTKRASSLDLIGSKSSPLGFLNLSVDNLQTKVTPLSNPNFAKVEFQGGVLGYQLNPSEIPKSWNVDTTQIDSSALHRSYNVADAGCANQQSQDQYSDPPVYCRDGNSAPFAMLVKQHGRWYFSLAYTALEYWRISENLPPADFGAALTAAGSGGSSPQDAVTQLIQAGSNLNNVSDLDRIFALLPPDELGALYDYRDAIHEALQNNDVTFPGHLYDLIGTPAFDLGPGKGDTRVYANHVQVHYSTTQTSSGDYTCGEFSDEYCGDSSNPVTGDVTVTRSCVTDTQSNEGKSQCLTDNRFATDLGLTDIFVSTVKENGRWYVSPMATLGDYVDIVVGHLDKASLDKFKRDLQAYDSGSNGFAAGTWNGTGGSGLPGALTQPSW